jgi:hemerythrin-like metal-binding protein
LGQATNLGSDRRDGGWLGNAGTHKQAVNAFLEYVHSLSNRWTTEALEAEHEAIEAILQSLWKAVISGAACAEIREILSAAVDLCTTHFADEEEVMRRGNHEGLDAHIAAHKQLLGKIVAARGAAAGEGMSLAVLDATDLLDSFHEHVSTYDAALALAPIRLTNPV